VLLALIALPLLALSALDAGIVGLVLGSPAALTVLTGGLLILAPATLSVFFFVWRGPGMTAYLFMLASLVLTQVGSMWLKGGVHGQGISAGPAALLAGGFVALAFILTRRALQQGTRAYRVQANALGNVWSAGR
jgi:hypothetical protein